MKFKKAIGKFRGLTPEHVRAWLNANPERVYFGTTHWKDQPELYNPVSCFIREHIGVREVSVNAFGHIEIGNDAGMVRVHHRADWWVRWAKETYSSHKGVQDKNDVLKALNKAVDVVMQ